QTKKPSVAAARSATTRPMTTGTRDRPSAPTEESRAGSDLPPMGRPGTAIPPPTTLPGPGPTLPGPTLAGPRFAGPRFTERGLGPGPARSVPRGPEPFSGGIASRGAIAWVT